MKDPAFLFYDGDAARDVSHMNRLERGCYFDFIQAQRKFGPMSEHIIRKILGADFEMCWESLKICLTCENDMYYIAWLQESTKKRQQYSESRRRNRLKSLNKSKNPQNNNTSLSYVQHMNSYVVHMENENENVIENRNRNKKESMKGKEEIENFIQTKIFRQVSSFFHLSEIRNAREFMDLNSFLNIRKKKGNLAEFERQFPAYCEYKEITKQATHSFRSFIGDMTTDSGGWSTRDWASELEKIKNSRNYKLTRAEIFES